MGWKTINGRSYYYRSRRVGGRVTTEYLGPAERGALFSLLDDEAREERAAEREAERIALEDAEREEREMAEWFDRIETVAEAALIAAGFHRHNRGEWRRSRDGGIDQSTGGVAGRDSQGSGRD